ncbi:hypothetical protein OA492_02830 [Pelagibacteraceae bacterium]|nr:hypothetical protein [Pelagibacteraceae bacterium]
MKTLLTILIFSFSVVAEDISDFEIDGMSIGDSLLKHYDKNEILLFEKLYSKFNNRKFYTINVKSKTNRYDNIMIRLENDDDNFIIYNLVGEINYKQIDINKCKQLKNDVINEISNLFKSIKPNSYDSLYDYMDDGKSIAYVTDFKLEGGFIRLWCRNWSKITENTRFFNDDFSVNITSNTYIEWMKNNKQ